MVCEKMPTKNVLLGRENEEFGVSSSKTILVLQDMAMIFGYTTDNKPNVITLVWKKGVSPAFGRLNAACCLFLLDVLRFV